MKFQLLNSTALINKARCTIGNVSRISTTVLVSCQINQACSWISKLCNWSSKICTSDWGGRIWKFSNVLNWHTIGLLLVNLCLKKSRGKIYNFYQVSPDKCRTGKVRPSNSSVSASSSPVPYQMYCTSGSNPSCCQVWGYFSNTVMGLLGPGSFCFIGHCKALCMHTRLSFCLKKLSQSRQIRHLQRIWKFCWQWA